MSAKLNFVRQQGLQEASSNSCGYQFPALMWQPRATAILVVIGLVLQDWHYFVILSALLWWNALLPALNPFDALYNRLVAKPKGLPPLMPALGPRRFAQGMAGTFMLAVGVCLRFDQHVLAWVIEGFLVVALSALIFGRLCIGSYLYWLFTGHANVANRTLPWSASD